MNLNANRAPAPQDPSLGTQFGPAAAWLLPPYLGWVTFATVLNAVLWRLNSP